MTFDLTTAAGARAYIAQFELCGKHPNHVVTSAGRRIMFCRMTDQDAIDVANMLWDLECEAARNAVKN